MPRRALPNAASASIRPSILNTRPKISSPLTTEIVFACQDLIQPSLSPPSTSILTLTLALDAFLSIYLALAALSQLLGLATLLDSQPFDSQPYLPCLPFRNVCSHPSALIAGLARHTSQWTTHPLVIPFLLAALVSFKLIFGLITLTSATLSPRSYLFRTAAAYLVLALTATVHFHAIRLPPGLTTTLALTGASTTLLILAVIALAILIASPALWLIRQLIDEEDRLAQATSTEQSTFPVLLTTHWFPSTPASAIPAHKRALIRREF